MNEYRLTRSQLYPHGTLGANDVKAREGHYIRGESPSEALIEMHKRYPKETHFTVELWKKDVYEPPVKCDGCEKCKSSAT